MFHLVAAWVSVLASIAIFVFALAVVRQLIGVLLSGEWTREHSIDALLNLGTFFVALMIGVTGVHAALPL